MAITSAPIGRVTFRKSRLTNQPTNQRTDMRAQREVTLQIGFYYTQRKEGYAIRFYLNSINSDNHFLVQHLNMYVRIINI